MIRHPALNPSLSFAGALVLVVTIACFCLGPSETPARTWKNNIRPRVAARTSSKNQSTWYNRAAGTQTALSLLASGRVQRTLAVESGATGNMLNSSLWNAPAAAAGVRRDQRSGAVEAPAANDKITPAKVSVQGGKSLAGSAGQRAAKPLYPCFVGPAIRGMLKKRPGYRGGELPAADNPGTQAAVRRRARPRPTATGGPAVGAAAAAAAATAGERRCSAPVFIRRSTPGTVALVSFPGSGNTWLRLLLEQATGIYTGSVYFDSRLFKAGLAGERVVSSAVSVVKYHAGSVANSAIQCPDGNSVTGGVLLVRNPYDAFVAEFNRLSTHSHVGAVPEAVIRKDAATWTGYVARMSKKFVDLVQAWGRLDVPFHTLYYEDLRNDTRAELQKVITFLRLPTSAHLLDCVSGHNFGTFHRKHGANGSSPGRGVGRRALFRDQHVGTVNAALKLADRVIPGIYRRYAEGDA